MHTLKTQTINGMKWQIGVNIAQKVVSFCATIILARLLGPSVFGLFSLTMIIVTSFELFKSLGIDSALIRKHDDFEKAADTAFIIIPLLGISLYIILFFSMPSIGKYLNNKELVLISRVLGVIFIFNCFSKVPQVILERSMQFKKLSIAEFFSGVIFSVSAIIFAFLNFSVWSLVYAYIIKVITGMLFVWIYAKWKPRLNFDRKIAIEMLDFGKFVLLSSLAWFLRMNLDNVLVSKLLGITMLGYYAVAFNIANFGADYFGNKVYRVIYPAYAQLQNDLNSLKSIFLKTLKHISIIAFPLGIGIFILGGDFLKIAYGNKWLEAISVLRILAWAGIFNVLPAATGAVFLALGKPKLSFFTTLLQVLIFFVFIAPMTKLFGINGVGITVSASSFIAFYIELVFISKILNLNFKQLYLCFKPSVQSSLIMIIAVFSLKHIMFLIKIPTAFYSTFLFMVFIAIFVYWSSLYVYNKTILKEIKELIF